MDFSLSLEISEIARGEACQPYKLDMLNDSFQGIGGGGGSKIVFFVSTVSQLGPPVVPFYRFLFGWEGSPTNIDYRKNIGY